MALCIVFVTTFMVISASGQAGTATIAGTITNAQSEVVPGATVTLVDMGRNSRRTVVTSDQGGYIFNLVQPGLYKLEVEAKGFKKSVTQEFSALVDKTTTIPIALEIGDISAVVNVDTAGLDSIINTQDASIGNNFVHQQIVQLPLQGRNVAGLLSLQPGVAPDGSVTGGRSDQANITLDGVDVNNQQDASAFTPVLRVNPDSVEEFRVTTANPEASRGRSAGAQISLITRAGTNDFHGSVYEYHRNTATTANDWFNNRSGIARPKLIRNLFGGSIGGPIKKDTAFFFYNYEGMRQASGTSVSRQVPLPSLGQGIMSFNDNTGQLWTLDTTQINSLTLNGQPVVNVNPLIPPLFAAAAARYPANDSTQGDGRNTSGFRFNAPTPVEQNAHTARIDWTLTKDQKHQISARGNYQQDITGVAPFFPDTPPTNTWSHPLGFQVAHTWLINSNVTNRFNYGYTRLAFSNQGDSIDPQITFRNIYSPSAFAREFSRTNPTTNITDDLTWLKGNHTIQFGVNFRFISNSRLNYARAFDNGITNFSAYQSNPARVALNQYITAQAGATRSVASSQDIFTQSTLVALFGRLNQYGANFNFNVDGTLQPENTPVLRIFETQEYDWYIQDVYKLRQNITITAGLRYGLSVPVTETQGYETVPTIELSEYLRRTAYYQDRGINYRETVSVRLAGKANGLDSIYPMDTNNFQPRVSIAWSPDFKDGFLAKMFGRNQESVFRAGFAITNDYFGQQLATNWDGANTLGFSSSSNINVNRYVIVDGPNAAPLYTSPTMSIRSLPNIVVPTSLTFPQTAPVTPPGLGKIETSLDQNLVSPINYQWNVSYGRELPWKIWVDVAYIGRQARNLLIGRDVMMLRDIRDPRSGMSYNEAGTILDRQLQAGVPYTQVASLAFYDNMWAPGTLGTMIFGPSGAGLTNTQAVYELQPLAGDWTYTMTTLDDITGSRYFTQGQYDALSAFGTVGSSDYHGGTVSVRQRLAGLTWDFNYTFSHSFDEASGLQTGGLFGSTFVLNAFKLGDQRAESDFDVRHVVNFNGIWEVPVGRGRKYASGMNGFLDAVFGGWQLSGIYRYQSGIPWTGGYFDSTGWQTNWQIRSYNVNLAPVATGYNYGSASNSCSSGCDIPNLFADPDAVYASFRTPHPGETGTRNAIRYPPTWNIDAGLYKSFNMPWKEGHKLTFRWEVFNVLNKPFFNGQATGVIGYTGSSASTNFGRYTQMANSPRIMQFALRYDF